MSVSYIWQITFPSLKQYHGPTDAMAMPGLPGSLGIEVRRDIEGFSW